MSKKNKVLHPQVFDFTIFPLSDPHEAIKQAKGSNQLKLMVVYAIESNPKEDLAFLSKVLKAAKIDIDQDICLLGLTANEHISFGHLKSIIEIEKMLVFGKSPTELGINIVAPLYQEVMTNDHTFLFGHSLQEIAEKKELKGSLWGALKKIFLSE